MIHTTTSRILASQKEKVQCLQETTSKFFFYFIHLQRFGKKWTQIIKGGFAIMYNFDFHHVCFQFKIF